MESIGMFALVVIAVAVIALLCAVPTLLLWNWLMPVLFGFKTITFVQAIGINFLTAILFKPNASVSK